MDSFDVILFRLKEAVRIRTDKGIAELLGLSPTAFNERKKRGYFPEDKLLAAMIKRPDLKIDLDYVLTGRRKTVLEELGEQGYLPGQAIQSVLGYGTDQEKKPSPPITKDEIELLQRFQRAPFEIKAQVMQLLSGVDVKSSPQSSQTFNGDVSGGEFAARDIVNHGRTRKK